MERGNLANDNTVYGPMKEITFQEVRLVLGKKKSGKAMGPSGVVVEMLTAAGDVGVGDWPQWVIDLSNALPKQPPEPAIFY